MPLAVSCLLSTVRNTSGRKMKFGFLPPHGVELDSNEEFNVFGDIKQAIIKFDRGESRRSIVAFEKALQRGDLEILSTPNPILRDINNQATTKMLVFRGGTLGAEDPCWNTSQSVEPTLG